MSRILVPILGDQLSPAIAALDGLRPADCVILLAEVGAEASYVGHHRQKLAFIFAAMRHFAAELRAGGWSVDYTRLDDPANTGTLGGEVARACQRHGLDRVRVTEPGEWRVLSDMEHWTPAPEIVPDTRFLCSHETFRGWAEGRKGLRMEHFYRLMRRRTGLLMEGEEPAGGRWNFDAENRKPARADLFMPRPLRIAPDAVTAEVLALVAKRFPDNFGDLDHFGWPVTRADAERAAETFMTQALPRFGDFQDAMLRDEKFLWHSVLSPLINVGLLDPLALCQRAERAWREGLAPLNAVEGFIRQIIGWREYVRGIYWREGPDYLHRNALDARRALPEFYWTGNTGMACVAAAVTQTREEAYAHHIQRLMVTGNFALLAGIDPHALHEWYLAVYADAFEWVEAPNTLGMSQFADGGLLGSKPYAASGAYIDRMSDYCGSCRYDVKRKVGKDACPLNALYWHFVDRHAERLSGNPRMAPVYRTWGRMAEDRRRALLDHAGSFLDHLDREGSDL